MDYDKAVKRALKNARPASMTAKALISTVLEDGGSGKDESKQTKKDAKKGVAAALNALITRGKVSISDDGGATWEGKKRTVEDADEVVPKKKAKKAKKSKKGEKVEKKEKTKDSSTKTEAAAAAAAASDIAAHVEPKADEAAITLLANATVNEGLVEGDDGWVKPSADQVTILLFYAYVQTQFNRYASKQVSILWRIPPGLCSTRHRWGALYPPCNGY